MIKTLLNRLFYKIYISGKAQDDALQRKIRAQELERQAIIGPETRVTREAIIQNSQNDKSKIIIGKCSLISGDLLVFKHSGEINIGEHCFVGTNSKIWSAKHIHIGNRVLISHNVNIHDSNSHPTNAIDRHKDFVHIFNIGLQDNISLNENEIFIEDDVWIGFNCTILKGVRIGKGAIIGACTTITENIPPNAVVVGNPSRIIKYVN